MGTRQMELSLDTYGFNPHYYIYLQLFIIKLIEIILNIELILFNIQILCPIEIGTINI